MTANAKYKQYKNEGGTLTFKEWIDREKKKGFVNATGSPEVPINKPLNDSIQTTLETLRRDAGYQDKLDDRYILGVEKQKLVLIGIVTVSIVAGIILYNKIKD